MKTAKQNSKSVERVNFLSLLLLITCQIFNSSPVSAYNNFYDAGEFEGAVWKFEMTSKAERRKKLQGRFRVENNVLYQKKTPDDPSYSKAVGKNYPKKLKTRMVLTDFRAFTKKGKVVTDMKGSFWLDFNRLGHWSGTMIDGKGTHWNFKCVRFQE
ncbi:hypothetical protein [Gimesia sp.]|uniref:hypothetical protein n=1 Tax=Gimesia sp. TaxID=2024833 RepID=UPI003A943FB2